MLFSSSVFLFQFLPLVLALYYIPFRDRRGAQNLLLLLASLFFYAWGDYANLSLMVFSTAFECVFWFSVHRSICQCSYLTSAIASTVVGNVACRVLL